MYPRNHYKLTTDEEFRLLVPALSKDHLEELKHQIHYYGLDHPIITWHKIIVFGFEEYEICSKNNVPFSIEELDFTFRSEVLNYICRKCLDLEYLTPEQNRYCIGKYYESKKRVLSDNYPRQNQFTPDPYRRPAHMLTNELCALELKEVRVLKPGTICTYGRYAAAVDGIFRKNKSIARDLLTGMFRLSIENTIILSRLTAPEIVVVRDRIMNTGDLEILHSGTLRSHHVAKIKAETDGIKRKAPEIKQMPKYDPDAEISSMTFTIPSWISSIERISNHADFRNASNAALEKLGLKLQILQEATNLLMAAIKESQNE